MYDAIINPARGRRLPKIGPVAIMAGGQNDLHFLCRLMNLREDSFSSLLISRLYTGDDCATGFSLVGPLVGAAYAAMLLENLIARGAQRILFFGLCGAVSPDVRIGDTVIPTCSIIDEGVSIHYNQVPSQEGTHPDNENDRYLAWPSENMLERTKDCLKKSGLSFHEGVVWSTGAIYRETEERIKRFQEEGVLAVEMETSALFTVGRYRNVEVGGILVVSDELSTFNWQRGFREKRFRKGCRAVCKAIKDLCRPES